MARKKGQIYSSEQKSKIVLELFKEEQTVNQLATKYKEDQSTTLPLRGFLEHLSTEISISLERTLVGKRSTDAYVCFMRFTFIE